MTYRETTAQLRQLIPADILVMNESGIKTADDVRRLRDTAVDAVLVGETLVKSKDVYETTGALACAAKLGTLQPRPVYIYQKAGNYHPSGNNTNKSGGLNENA